MDSNGGGTAIDGATEATYTPPTTESGTIYYYVVVTNTVGDGVQLTASGTKCVTITEQEAAPEETRGIHRKTLQKRLQKKQLPEAGSRPMETGGIRMRTELIQPAAGRKLTVSGMYLTRTDISVPVGIRKEISGIISRKTVQWHMIRM